EFIDAQMIHHADMVIGIRIPRAIDLNRTRRLAGIGVAQVRRDAAVLSLELVDGVKGQSAQPGDDPVQSPARNEQQREAGTVFFIVNANWTFFVKRHSSPSDFLLIVVEIVPDAFNMSTTLTFARPDKKTHDYTMNTVDVGHVIDEGSWTTYQKLLILGTALTI